MDIAICCINKEKQIIEFSGAHNPLLIIENEQEKLIKADKFSAGGKHKRKEKEFTKHTIQYNSPTTFYIYSDGFQDQFGGPKNQKYLAKRFRKFLKNNSSQTINQQKIALQNEISDWINKPNKQIDDILVIGFQL